MKSGPIEPIPSEHIDDRRERRLPLWERDDVTPKMPVLPWARLSHQTKWMPPPQAVAIAVACPRTRPSLVDEFVLAALRADLRVYLLAGPDFGNTRADQEVLVAGRRRLLVRQTTGEPAATFVVAGRGETGILFLGPSGQSPTWVEVLDRASAAEIFCTFVHSFWHEAVRERRPDSSGEPAFLECLQAPVPRPVAAPRFGRCALVPAREQPTPLLEAPHVAVEPDGESAGEGTKRLYVPPTALDANALRAVAAQQTALTWLDMGLPRLAVTPQRMVVELSNGADRLRIDYDTRIAVDVLKQLGVPRPGAWSFEPERPVGKARRNVWLAGASSEVVLADEVPVPLGDLRPPNILELERHAPAHWPEPPGLARKVRYQWRNVPPVAPAPATIAQLRRDWQALDEWADGRIDVCRKASTELKKGRHFLQRLFDGATRTALATIDAGLDELAELPPSQRPIEDVPGVLAEIASQENALDALARKMHVDAEAVRAKEAEDQQRAEHDKLVQAASESARALELQMTEVGVRLEAAQAEVRRLVSLQEARQAELRQIHLAALRVEAEQRLPALTAELEEASGALHRAQGEQREAKKKSAKKDARRAVQEAERRTARLDEELARLAKAVAGEVDLADSTMSADERIVALRGQLEAAAARLATEESEKERLRGELARAQQKAQLAFDFRPPSGTAAPRPIQRKPPPPTPAESLPEKGLLLEHAGRRFLVVTTWEEARQATSDADRLKALLVIPSPEAPRR